MDYNRDRKCTDCKFSHRGIIERILSVQVYRCRHPDNMEPGTYSPVTGKTSKAEFRSCGVARLHTSFCGPSGNKWVPKDTRKHLFTVLSDRTT